MAEVEQGVTVTSNLRIDKYRMVWSVKTNSVHEGFRLMRVISRPSTARCTLAMYVLLLGEPYLPTGIVYGGRGDQP